MPTDAPFSLESMPTGAGPRAGRLELAHGTVDTPVFMPVGTQAAVKALAPDELRAHGAQIILANTYHLLLRPGPERLKRLGGLHRFMRWDGNILTDSGGYQVMSLAALARLDDRGVDFRSHLDGQALRLTPESVLVAQDAFGSDVLMPLDVCPRLPATPEVLEHAVSVTSNWARQSAQWYSGRRQRGDFAGRLLFAINQGGVDAALRRRSAEELMEIDLPGYAIGGLMVGEPKPQTFETVAALGDLLPIERPRYLMGVGTPLDLLDGVARGIDMFDCVMPTRNARNGQVFTRQGKLIIKHAAHRDADLPLDASCACYTCQHFSRAYLRHLFVAGEVLALRLLSLHSVAFYLALLAEIRQSILAGDFAALKAEYEAAYADAERRRLAES